MAPVASTSQSNPSAPSRSSKRRPAGSTATASPSTTSTLACRRSTRRMGMAMSPGESAAVATS